MKKAIAVTSHLFRRRALRMRVPLAGAAAFLAGAIAVYFGQMGGVIGIVAGLALIALGVVSGKKALVSIDANGLLLRFANEVPVAFASIDKVGIVKEKGIELTLHSGTSILIPLEQLEEGDGE